MLTSQKLLSKSMQGRGKGTSCVAFEVLMIKCEIDFINLFILNCLTSNINLFIFNCLTSNINLFNFNCLTSSFCFPKNIFFCKQKRTDVYGRASLVLGFQLNRENDDLLSSRHKEIFEVQHPVHEHAKLQIPDKRYRTNTRLEFFEGPTVPQL